MRLRSSIVAILFAGLFLNAQEANQQVLIGRLSALAPLSAAQVAELENRVRVNAGDEAARTRLLRHYAEFPPAPGGDAVVRQAVIRHARLAHILWLIENRAGNPSTVSRKTAVSPSRGPYADAADYSTVSRAWEFAVAHDPTSAAVHLNAARFLFAESPEKAEAILTRFLEFDRDNRVVAATLGFLYACDILGLTGPFEVSARPAQEQTQLAGKARAALDQTANAFVLAGAGTALPNLFPRTPAARNPNADRTPFELASTLMAKARQLAPGALDGPMPLAGEFARFQAGDELAAPQPPVITSAAADGGPSRLRIAANVQAAKLIQKPEAVYPALAMQARIQGTVRFEVLVAEDGTVANATLVSGHPLLVAAAQEALRGYRYQPTLLNGRPVAIVTTVDIPFVMGR
ncbi:MAG: energy transducer TonB [Bryobacterales bacterium]|nr:energy transducer TonB [Bryobacterales bacterium]